MIPGDVIYHGIHTTFAALGNPPRGFDWIAFFLNGSFTKVFVPTFPMIRERHEGTTSGISIDAINDALFLGAAIFPTVMGRVLDDYWTGKLVDF